jgi:hypothetical protein
VNSDPRVKWLHGRRYANNIKQQDRESSFSVIRSLQDRTCIVDLILISEIVMLVMIIMLKDVMPSVVVP